MSKLKTDLTDMDFGELHVRRYLGHGEWECECSCGNIKAFRTYTLTHGDAKSCGCKRKTACLQDITGQHFGEWEVLGYSGDGLWKCQCSCGTIKDVRVGDLKTGRSKSCGCQKRVDITGQVFGDLTVDSYDKTKYRYKCICSCGNIVYTTRYELETRGVRSCGKHPKYEDISGEKFGEWTALEYMGDYKWKCECSCGIKKIVGRYDLISGKSTSCGHTRRKHDILNKQFGELKVLRYTDDYNCECLCSCGTIKEYKIANIISGGTRSCGCKQHEKLFTKEDISKTINDIVTETKDLPFIQDIADRLCIHKETARQYIKNYELSDRINKRFGSKPERDVYNMLSRYTNNIELHNRTVLNGQELDFYIPDAKLAVEFNGNYWHSDEKVEYNYHQNKTIDCAKKCIQLVHIFEYELEDINFKQKIDAMFRRLLSEVQTVYARNTHVREITDTSKLKDFLNKYHLQGYATSSINLGCFGVNDELLGVLTLGRPRFNNEYEYEIIRLCWASDIRVTGGTEKLFTYFVRNYNPKSVITYSDISKFTGNVYVRLGFEPLQDCITYPNYIWLNRITNDKLSRYQTQKKNLVKQGLGTEDESENDIMSRLGYIKIYDCGNIKLGYTNQERKDI